MQKNCFLILALMTSVYGYAAKVGTFPITVNWGTENAFVVQGGDYLGFADYVSGGVTFTYPANMFQEAPVVVVALQMAGRAYATNQLCVAEIISNSPTSTTIRVNVHTGFIVREASTNDVTIHLRAVAKI